jgi:hypothetical protein
VEYGQREDRSKIESIYGKDKAEKMESPNI